MPRTCQKSPLFELLLHRNPLKNLNFGRSDRVPADVGTEAYRLASRIKYRNLSMWQVLTRILPMGLPRVASSRGRPRTNARR